MKKRMINFLMSVLLVTAFSAATASAKNIATAVLEKEEGGNDVSVAIELPQNKSETVTSLRFKLLVAVEETGQVAFDGQSVSFDFAEVPVEVKDAVVWYDPEVTDYVVDVIVSGKEPIFQGTDGAALPIGTLRLPDGEYYAEVGCVVTDDEQDSTSKLQYTDSVGLETMSASLKDSETIFIGKKEQSDTEQEETPSVPQDPGNAQEPQEETPDLTEPVPSGSAIGAGTQTETAPESEPAPAQRPPLQPAEPRRNGLAAPKLTVKAVTGTEQLSFTWKAVKGAKGYQIYKYDEASGEYKKQKNVKGTSYTAKYAYGEICRFRVRAYKKEKGSTVYGPFSAEKEVTVSSFNKNESVNVQVTIPAKGRKLHFAWNSVPGADGYQILRYNDAKKRYKVVRTISAADVTQCRAVKYKFATDYRFEMRAFAYDEDENMVFGEAGSEASITTPPDQVSRIRVKSPEEFTISVTWKKVPGADGYFIYRSEPDDKSVMKRIAKVKSNVSNYVDENLDGGARYYYQVAAFRRSKTGKRRMIGAMSVMRSAEVK